MYLAYHIVYSQQKKQLITSNKFIHPAYYAKQFKYLTISQTILQYPYKIYSVAVSHTTYKIIQIYMDSIIYTIFIH